VDEPVSALPQLPRSQSIVIDDSPIATLASIPPKAVVAARAHQIDELLSEMEQRLGFKVTLAPAGRVALEHISTDDESALRLLIVTSALRHLIVQKESI
jgi:hypothetical protein